MSTTHADAPDASAAATTAPPILASLSIVVHCCNEEADLAAAVADAHRAGERWAARHEIIVVDGGSSDRTREIADSIARDDAQVTVVAHEHDSGFGEAVRAGIAASRGAWVLLTDAHLRFDLSELSFLVPLTADANLVAGYRIDRADWVGRRLAALAWGRLMRRTFGIGLRDVDYAFKLVRGPAVRGLDLQSTGTMLSTELVLRAQQAGWAIAEVGVHHRARPAAKPSARTLHVVAEAFRERRALMARLRADTADAPRMPFVTDRARRAARRRD